MDNLISMKSFSKNLNDYTFTDYYWRLMLLATSRFKWGNLPNNINEKWIEKFLFKKGECIYYEDDILGPMITEFTADEEVNNYNEPIAVTPCGVGIPEPRRLIVDQDCVIIRNNDMSLPTSYFVQLFAYRLAEISRAIDVNVNAQKTPVLVVGSDKQKLSLKNIYAQYTGNEPVIFGDKTLNTDILKVLNTQAPIVFPQLQEQKQNTWNECLTFLGINNANTDKRERLITDEVKANDTHIDLSAECFLKAREDAVEKINKIFGQNITIEERGEDEEVCMQDTQNISET